MSDRIAVFNEGHIEQVGTPADVYERPATEFVAGFVGTSNLISGPAAKELLGHEGTFSVRPEKISVQPAADGSAGSDDTRVLAAGEVTEVVYAGPATRLVVRLDAGPELVALQQNSGTHNGSHIGGIDDHAIRRGGRVRLEFRRDHIYRVSGAATSGGNG